jgi:hypothetical protein
MTGRQEKANSSLSHLLTHTRMYSEDAITSGKIQSVILNSVKFLSFPGGGNSVT